MNGMVRLEREGDVAVLTLDDPATRNALSWVMAEAIGDALGRLGDARALLITGAGQAFCSGGDMGMEGAGEPGFGEVLADGLTQSVNPMLTRLAAIDIPVVAAVHGAAAGAGASLALSADLVIADESAFFFFAFPQVGLALDAGASWILPRLVGTARALEALMLAERIGSQKALEWGMIAKAVPDDELTKEAGALAARLAAGPTTAYAQIRKAVRNAQAQTYEQALAAELDVQRIAGNTQDCRAAIQAFREKRKPVFSG